MMTTDEERREVARRLRENAEAHPDMSLLLNVAFADDSLRLDGAMEWKVTPRDAAMRLADLIEPRDMSQSCRDSVACDRYTLLALADVLEVHARKIAQVRALINDKEQKRIFDDLEGCLLDIAACIREALGVTS